MNIFHKTQKKETRKLPMTGKVKKGFRYYCAAVLSVTAVFAMSTTAFAASDPLTVVNNLSDFIFGFIRAIGLILLGFGIVQVHGPAGIPRQHHGIPGADEFAPVGFESGQIPLPAGKDIHGFICP